MSEGPEPKTERREPWLERRRKFAGDEPWVLTDTKHTEWGMICKRRGTNVVGQSQMSRRRQIVGKQFSVTPEFRRDSERQVCLFVSLDVSGHREKKKYKFWEQCWKISARQKNEKMKMWQVERGIKAFQTERNDTFNLEWRFKNIHLSVQTVSFAG